jgi:hypothetical protein
MLPGEAHAHTKVLNPCRSCQAMEKPIRDNILREYPWEKIITNSNRTYNEAIATKRQLRRQAADWMTPRK